MRIQVLPLTTERAGAIEQTPFVLVFDKVTEQDRADLLPFMLEGPGMRERLGAREVLIVAGELTVENVDRELHEAAADAVRRALDRV